MSQVGYSFSHHFHFIQYFLVFVFDFLEFLSLTTQPLTFEQVLIKVQTVIINMMVLTNLNV